MRCFFGDTRSFQRPLPLPPPGHQISCISFIPNHRRKEKPGHMIFHRCTHSPKPRKTYLPAALFDHSFDWKSVWIGVPRPPAGGSSPYPPQSTLSTTCQEKKKGGGKPWQGNPSRDSRNFSFSHQSLFPFFPLPGNGGRRGGFGLTLKILFHGGSQGYGGAGAREGGCALGSWESYLPPFLFERGEGGVIFFFGLFPFSFPFPLFPNLRGDQILKVRLKSNVGGPLTLPTLPYIPGL